MISRIRHFTFAVAAAFLLTAFSSARAADGMITVKSAHDVATTETRLVKALNRKGMTVFAQVDHDGGAASAGLELRPTRLVLFGNPKAGTPLMQCQQSVAMDLPQKALIWEDADGQAWLSYNSVAYLAKRHGMSGCDAALDKVAGALKAFAKAATAP
jgi:uncharacterized protein (DUF302 family)